MLNTRMYDLWFTFYTYICFLLVFKENSMPQLCIAIILEQSC